MSNTTFPFPTLLARVPSDILGDFRVGVWHASTFEPFRLVLLLPDCFKTVFKHISIKIYRQIKVVFRACRCFKIVHCISPWVSRGPLSHLLLQRRESSQRLSENLTPIH